MFFWLIFVGICISEYCTSYSKPFHKRCNAIVRTDCFHHLIICKHTDKTCNRKTERAIWTIRLYKRKSVIFHRLDSAHIMGVRLVRGAGRRGPMRHVYLGLLHPLAGKRPIFYSPCLKTSCIYLFQAWIFGKTRYRRKNATQSRLKQVRWQLLPLLTQ